MSSVFEPSIVANVIAFVKLHQFAKFRMPDADSGQNLFANISNNKIATLA